MEVRANNVMRRCSRRRDMASNLPPGYTLAQQDWLGIPVTIYFMVILTIVVALWLRYSATGRALYAVGGNAEAARLSGINTRRIIMTAFILNGVMVGFSSVLLATQFNQIQIILY